MLYVRCTIPTFVQVDEVEEDGLRPACLRPAERNKNTRQTVRVSSFYESDAQTFEKKHVFKVTFAFLFLGDINLRGLSYLIFQNLVNMDYCGAKFVF